MPSEDTKILHFNEHRKSDKVPFIIHTGLQYTTEKIDGFKNNLESSSISKISEDIPLGFWMRAISFFRSIENKLDFYRSKGCMKRDLRDHAMKLINLKNKTKT